MDFGILIPILLGWVGGLFINYIADVLPHTRKLSQPICPHCQTQFSWTEYLTLHACRSCGKKRSLRTWLVLVLTTASFAYFWLFPSKALGIPLGMIVLVYFGIVTVIDLEHRLILHSTSIAGAVIGLVAGTYLNSRINNNGLLLGAGMSLLGGVFGFGVMFLFYQLGAILARYRARKLQADGRPDDEEEALGGGDVFLLGVLGLMLGWPFIWDTLLLGILLGGAVSLIFLVLLLVRRKYSSEALMTFIPYGPYFIAGAFFKLFL